VQTVSRIGACAIDRWPDTERARLEHMEQMPWPVAPREVQGRTGFVAATLSPIASHAGLQALRRLPMRPWPPRSPKWPLTWAPSCPTLGSCSSSTSMRKAGKSSRWMPDGIHIWGRPIQATAWTAEQPGVLVFAEGE